MKSLLLTLLLLFVLTSCENESEDTPLPAYTIENEMLSIDLSSSTTQLMPLIFECNGGRINFQDPDYPERYDWVRLGADCN